MAVTASSKVLAVVGSACRFPGGIEDPGGLWKALERGRELTGRVPAGRFDAARWLDPERTRPGKTYSAAGGFLADISGFDAGYFGLPSDEAARTDPRQRLLLELAVEALDDAGIPAENLAGTSAAVYVGASGEDYALLQGLDGRSADASTLTGGAAAGLARRVAHFLDLRGPGVVVDTGCSSSLVAVDHAAEALRTGRCRTALAAGVHVLLSPYGYVARAKAALLSPTGRCRPFAAGADGYVPAEGGGVLVLKTLRAAREDGDRVQAVVLASGTGADGRTGTGGEAQEALLRELYASAGVAPDDLGHLELGVTGEAAADRAECRAVGRALGVRRTAGRALPVGSAAAHLGHLEPASGMAGLFKALQVLRHRRIPAGPDGGPLDPETDFTALGLAPATAPSALRAAADGGRAVVGVNSRDLRAPGGGVHAHVILADPPDRPAPTPQPSTPLPVLVSARTPAAVAEAARRMADRLDGCVAEKDEDGGRDHGRAGGGCGGEGGTFYDLAYTSARRRTRHPYRAAVLADGPRQAARRLRETAQAAQAQAQAQAQVQAAQGASGAEASEWVRAAPRGRVAFAFPGAYGCLGAGGLTRLCAAVAGPLTAEPAFRAGVTEADEALRPLLGWSVTDVLTGRRVRRAGHGVGAVQTVLFAVQAGLVRVLRGYGVEPAAVTGHGTGEAVAAWAAGALDLRDAARVTVELARAQAATVGDWGMAALDVPVVRARQLLAPYQDRVTLAAVDSDREVTVSGDRAALLLFTQDCRRAGVPCRDLGVDHAFHSRAVDGPAHGLRAALAAVKPGRARVPYVSAATGGALTGEELDAGYWARALREPVQFAAAVRHLRDLGCDVFADLGPGAVLTGPLRRTVRDAQGCTVVPVPVPDARADVGGAGASSAAGTTGAAEATGATEVTEAAEANGTEGLHAAVAQFVACGAQSGTEGFFPHPGQVADLPAYPWQRTPHWNGDPAAWVRSCGDGTLDHPLLGERVPVADPTWHGPVEPARLPWLTDHTLDGAVVMPAAGHLDMLLAAAHRALDAPVELTGVTFRHPLPLPCGPDARTELQTTVCADDGLAVVAARTGPGAPWKRHARARADRLTAPAPPPYDVERLSGGLTAVHSAEEHYRCTGDRLPEHPQSEDLQSEDPQSGHAQSEDAPERAAECPAERAHDRHGLQLGPAFRVLREVRTGTGEVLAHYRARLPAAGHAVPPALLEGALRAGTALLPGGVAGAQAAGAADHPARGERGAYLPVAVERVRAWRGPTSAGHVHVRVRACAPHEALWDVTLLAPDGQVRMVLEGLRMRLVPSSAGRAVARPRTTVLRAAPRPGQDLGPAPLPSPAHVAALVRDVTHPRDEGDGAEGTDGAGAADAVAHRARELAAHFGTAAVTALLGDRAQRPFGTADLVAAGVRETYVPLLRLLLHTAREHGLVTPVPAASQPGAPSGARSGALSGAPPAARPGRGTGTGAETRAVTGGSAVIGAGAGGGADACAWRLVRTAAPHERLRTQARRAPELSAALTLAAACGSRLPAVLRGDFDPAGLLLSASGRHLQDALYAQDPAHRAALRTLQTAVTELLRDRPAGRPLRVLHLGTSTGTGPAAASLLPLLPPDSAYCVHTAPSEAALCAARERLTAHGAADQGPGDARWENVQHRVLDPDLEPGRQGFAPGSFDLVVALDALHTVRDLRRALGHLTLLLADGGQLLAAEPHDPAALALTAGLLPGFWACEDTDLRPAGPLLTADGWRGLLAGEGWADPVVLDPDAPRAGARDATGPVRSVLLAGRPAHTAPTAPTRATAGAAAPGPKRKPVPARVSSWVIAAEPSRARLAVGVGELLSAAGHTVRSTGPSTDPDRWKTLLASCTGRVGVVLLLGEAGDGPAPDTVPCPDPGRAAGHAAVLRALATAAGVPDPAERAAATAAAGAGTDARADLWLVTPPTGLLPAPEQPVDPTAAAAWGVARCLGAGHPGVTVHRVSLAASADAEADAARLTAEFMDPGTERDVLLTPDGRFTAREQPRAGGRPQAPPHPDRAAADAEPSVSLHVTAPGAGYRLSWVPAPVPQPGPGELVVRVHAVAVHPRDVLQAQGVLAPEPPSAAPRASSPSSASAPPSASSVPSVPSVSAGPVGAGPVEARPVQAGPGLECAGVVVAVGGGVTGFAPGERVYGLGTGTLRSHAVLHAATAAHVPDGMDLHAAATLAAAHLTVHHALDHLARLQPGETVLVHGAAGGTGLAALPYVRQAGAHLLATAADPAARDLLRLLGVRHVLDARAPGLAEQVRELTGGRGADVVLNSAYGGAVRRGLELLAPGGRFVELGGREVHADGRLPLRPFRAGLTFAAADPARLAGDRTGPVEAAFAQVAAGVRDGAYRALPYHTYPSDRVADAFAAAAQPRHAGTVVVDLTASPRTRPEPSPTASVARRFSLAPEGTYLVTGALGGTGAVLARWLADRGARHLHLVGRHGTTDGTGARELVAALEAQGVETVVHTADVTDPAAVKRVVTLADSWANPLRGVVHAARTHDEGPSTGTTRTTDTTRTTGTNGPGSLTGLTGLTDEAVRAALAEGPGGAAALSAATADSQLDFFVLCASAAALLGSPRQAGPAAAGAALAAVARARRNAGLCALVFGWDLPDTGEPDSGVPTPDALPVLESLLADGTDVAVLAPAPGRQAV